MHFLLALKAIIWKVEKLEEMFINMQTCLNNLETKINSLAFKLDKIMPVEDKNQKRNRRL